MREIGLILRLKVKWLPKKPACDRDGLDFTVVGLTEIKPIIYAYLIGLTISIIVLFGELLPSVKWIK